MLVEEVSDVDRAANKRRFLVVKRDGDGDDMPTKLVPDGRGGHTRVRKADDEEEAAKAFPPGAKAPPFGAKPKPGEDDEDEDAKKERKEKRIAARKASLAAIGACVESLMNVAESMQKKGDDDEEEDDEIELRSGKAKKAIDELVKSLDTEVAVAKAGRRMSKERLDRFSSALEELSKILKEVMSAPELPDPTEKERAAASEKKSFSDPTEAGANGTPVGTDLELLGAVSNLKDVVKRQTLELETLRKSMGAASNASGPPERQRTRKSDEGDEWPMDMNRPITRANTPKEVSFYDD